MTEYLEYTKGGYVLIAPSLDYKHQYILKCFMCDDYYGEFETFLTHCHSHNDELFSDKLSNASDSLEDLYSEKEKGPADDCPTEGAEYYDAPHEYFEFEIEDVDPMKNEFIKEEDTFHDSDTYYRHIEIEQHDESNELNDYCSENFNNIANQDIKNDYDESIATNDESTHSFYDPQNEAENSDDHMIYPEDMCYEDVGTGMENSNCKKKSKTKKGKKRKIDNQSEESSEIVEENDTCNEDAESDERCKNSKNLNVKKFLRSERNTITLVEAYRRQYMLWNLNYMEYQRTKERIKCVQKIVNTLKRELNIHLTSDEVSAIIVFLRVKYKAYILNGRIYNNLSEDVLKRLHFLRPFMENNYIAVLSEELPYLKYSQITQFLKIYKQFPILWDNANIGHWCSNKRNEALDKLANVLRAKMNLQVNRNIMEKYVYAVHSFLTKEKYRDMGRGKGKPEPHPVYYEDMRFLYDYVSPFECSVCHKLLRSPLYFKEHLMKHDDSVCFKCSLCDKEFKLAEAYVDHAKRHLDDLNAKCNLCGKKYLKQSDLKAHIKSHAGFKTCVCDICGNAYRYISSLVIHKRKHNKEYIFHCDVCPKKFVSKTGLNTHMASHSTERTFVCEICNKAFKTKNTLKHHYWLHEGRSYPCDLCDKTFIHQYRLNDHMKIHRNKA